MRSEVLPPPRPARLSRFRSLGTLAGLIGLGLILPAGRCHAAPITFEYGGTITSAHPSTGAAPGARFSGTFRYDPEARVVSSQIANAQLFEFGNAAGAPGLSPDTSALSLKVGDLNVKQQEGKLRLGVVREYRPSDGTAGSRVILSSEYPDWVNAESSIEVSLILSNPDRWVLGTPYALPIPEELTLAALPASRLVVTKSPNGFPLSLYEGTIDTLTIVQTPEPSAIALLGLGVAGWLVRSRRRRLS
ncbi:PEP-CTERM sorting domain-containing protein [Tundrisphaera sp. TA3]|uniref:PEP-CTERM sorting domain-containing protein n=1 Tax=Tundrisphaera sp. TA3 TaxID=3435775 RepID=UPI003EBA13BD